MTTEAVLRNFEKRGVCLFIVFDYKITNRWKLECLVSKNKPTTDDWVIRGNAMLNPIYNRFNSRSEAESQIESIGESICKTYNY
ncbi:MAG: hypothetical protein HOO91_17710 [Bacteroidales bacterium]|nr:hypothetical protein [Bacteroidales bacterium]